MGHDAVDGALAELGGEGEDLGGDLTQAAVLLFQTVKFPPLSRGRPFGPPVSELLRIDIDEPELLAIDALDPIDGGGLVPPVPFGLALLLRSGL